MFYENTGISTNLYYCNIKKRNLKINVDE
eukprot:COSAG02_NODE_43628_length_373_cov_0.682482_2_plen_28_part_01